MGEEKSPAASGWKEVRVDIRKYRLFRVPKHVLDIDKEAYKPKFVCIGPYHRHHLDHDNVQNLKKRYLAELLNDVEPSDRTKQQEILQLCKCGLGKMVDDVRRFYAEDKEVCNIKHKEMVEMLLHDGCFIIKHLYNYAQAYNEQELYETRWKPAQLRIDLGLLENQIPFFVLVELFYYLTPKNIMAQNKRKKESTLKDMALWYMLQGWYPDLSSLKSPTKHMGIPPGEPVHHLLHLVHLAHRCMVQRAVEKRSHRLAGLLCCLWRCLLFLFHNFPLLLMRLLLYICCGCCRRRPRKMNPRENIASASQLRAFGISIHPAAEREDGGILDVRFNRYKATLEMPPLTVEQATVPLLQNLVAYEQQVGMPAEDKPQDSTVKEDTKHKDDTTPKEAKDDYFTTYAFLMYNLVSSSEDITLLQEQGILHNNLGSHETIIIYFKNLCRWNQRSEAKDTPVGKVLHELRRCSQDRAYREWAKMKKYVDSPVKVLAFLVSAVITASTILQKLKR